MTDLELASASIGLTAQVNNLAQAVFAKAAGAGSFSGAAAAYTLNFGSLTEDTFATSSLQLSNAAAAPGDALRGEFDPSVGGAFRVSGVSDFASLAAGDSLGGLTIRFEGSMLGTFDQMLVLQRTSINGSGPDLSLGDVTLRLQGRVVAVPEPASWLMALGGLAVLAARGRRTGWQPKAIPGRSG
ncbi:MAG: PEP-CTERM sorting domain-containing protein [Rubrivivax sp.]